MATKKVAEVVEIKPIEIATASIRIQGDTPLIMHRWSEKAKRMILDKEMGKSEVKKHPVKNPVEDFIDSLYWVSEKPDADNTTEEDAENMFNTAVDNGAQWGFPVTAVKAAAVSAAFRNGYSKDKVSLQGSFFIDGTGDELLEEVKGCVPHIREDMVRVGMGSADIRHRGEFDGWYMDLTIRFNKNGKMKLTDICNIINLGGFSCGIGEWRPEKGGSYGMYHVVATK